MPKNINKLLIFTKSPVLGEVKTRLQPVYSVEQSLSIHKKLMLSTLALTHDLNNIDIELCCTPNRNTLFFLDCENTFPITLSNQQGEELGEKMAYSLSVALKSYENVIVIGTDCPDLNKEYIEHAFKMLNEHDAVIGPAIDGGYVLLGLRKFSIDLFSQITWGSEHVFYQTKKVLDNLSWSYHELGIMHDIDRPEDCIRYKDLLNNII